MKVTGMDKPCLVTVTDPYFLPGALVMIFSFLKTNRWFSDAQGDIVIIHDHLPAELQRLFHVFQNVIFHQVSDILKEKVEELCVGVPELNLEMRKKRFYSLDLFLLQGYRKVLFCDSDIVFLDDIAELFHGSDPETDNRLFGVGDVFHFSGTAVEEQTFLPVTDANTAGQNSPAIKNTFNAGFFNCRSMLPRPPASQKVTGVDEPSQVAQN